MRLLIAVVGTLGDVLPAVAVGRLAARRGHEVRVIANPAFARLVAEAGLEPVPVGRVAEVQALVEHPAYWDPDRGFHWFAQQAVLPGLKPVAEAVERHAAGPARPVVAALNYAYGACHAGERLALPTARLLTQPAMVEGLAAGGARFARVIGTLETLLDYRGRTLGATGAAPAPPAAVVGLFPAWFVPAGTALPAEVRFTGFPLYDGPEGEPSAALDAFLRDGPPPVVVFGGSNGTRAREVLGRALAACRRLGGRAVVVTRDPAAPGVATDGDALVVPSAPFGRLLPRAAAVVHHGGIGTIGRCLAAGVPQLALTANFETPENAAAMAALGVGEAVAAAEATVPALAERLDALLASAAVAARCTEIATRMRADNPFERVGEILESLADAGR
jgi:UDP:flavonoid glycosyltransferase YjiC (YdhE family)